MKKIILATLLGLSVTASHAQIDMITSLKAMDGVVYTEYWNVVPVEGGKNTISEKRYVATVSPVKNRFGHIVGFDALSKENPAEKNIDYNYMYNIFDHYTHPSYSTGSASHAQVIINGCIFDLEHFESTTQFDIDKIWIPSVPKDKAADPVFKGAKMSDMKSVDLMKLIKDYFVEMKKIQDANPYNAAMQEEANTMKFIVDSTQLTYDNANAAYWNSPEGQAKLNQLRKPKVTLVNDTQTDVLMCYGQGVSTVLKPGEKKEFSCDNGKIFKGKLRANSDQLDSTGEVLLDLDGTGCGREIKASTL
ncbi:MAG TPA: hypothetical protein VK826_09535 [Bacteroidia bacterium]|nr:hypothetical protein [Bacteroidia bacterium]